MAPGAELEELAAEVMAASAERIVARRELSQMGINASPADIQAWLSMTPRQQDRAARSWAIYQAAEFLSNPGQNHYQEHE
jgi:hypothetical protein